MANEILHIKNLDKKFIVNKKEVHILKDINLTVEEGEFITIVGHSGCGKSTLLKIVAGLVDYEEGEVIRNGKKVVQPDTDCGMVFQEHRLLPWLKIKDNIGFGIKNLDKKKREELIGKHIKLVGLEGFENAYPSQLSGGMSQRAAIARALVIEPSLLLLDEPLSNLDAKLRLKMRVEIRKLQQKLGITTLFVTHDQEECFSISDRVAVLNKGVIEQFDTPENIYSNPSTEFVARFVGFENFIELTKVSEGIYENESGIKFNVDRHDSKDKTKGTIRPDDIRIVNEESMDNTIEGTVEIRTFLGKSYQYEVKTLMGNITVNGENSTIYNKGDKILLQLPSNKIVLV